MSRFYSVTFHGLMMSFTWMFTMDCIILENKWREHHKLAFKDPDAAASVCRGIFRTRWTIGFIIRWSNISLSLILILSDGIYWILVVGYSSYPVNVIATSWCEIILLIGTHIYLCLQDFLVQNIVSLMDMSLFNINFRRVRFHFCQLLSWVDKDKKKHSMTYNCHERSLYHGSFSLYMHRHGVDYTLHWLLKF